jgi:hypothetical protein
MAVSGQSRAANAKHWLRVILFAALVLLAVGQVAWTLVLVVQPSEIEYGEAIIHDQAARLVRGEPLYQDFSRPPYTVTAYTPAYYVVVAGLQLLFGPGFLPGRVVSVLSALGAMGIIGWLTAREAGAVWPGVVAALLFFDTGLGAGSGPVGSLAVQAASLVSGTLLADPKPAWSTMYKEDLFGVAMSLGAVAIIVWRPSVRGVALGGLLAGVALLTKQTFVAATIAGTISLWQSNRRAAVIFLCTDLLTVGLVSGWFELTTHAFVQNTVLANANPVSSAALTDNLKAFALFLGGPIIAAGVYLARGRVLARRRALAGLLALYWVATALPLIGIAKVGANYNYWIEFAAPTGALAALGIWHALKTYPARPAWSLADAPLVLVTATSALLAGLLCAPLLYASAKHAQTARDSATPAEFQTLIERVRSAPGEILASPLDVITLAGRRVLLEPYIFSIWASTGQWDSVPLVQRICGGAVGLLVLDQPIEQPFAEFEGYSLWPPPVVAALRQAAVFDTETAGRFVYRLSRPCAAVAASVESFHQ